MEAGQGARSFLPRNHDRERDIGDCYRRYNSDRAGGGLGTSGGRGCGGTSRRVDALWSGGLACSEHACSVTASTRNSRPADRSSVGLVGDWCSAGGGSRDRVQSAAIIESV